MFSQLTSRFLVFGIVFLVTILTLISSSYLNIPRPFFIYETFLVLPVAYFLGAYVASVYLFFILSLDLIGHVGLAYFHNIAQVITNFKFFLSHSYIFYFFMMQIMLLFLSVVFYKLIKSFSKDRLRKYSYFFLFLSMSVFLIDNVILDEGRITTYLAKNRIYPSNFKNISNSLLNAIYQDSLENYKSKENMDIFKLEEAPNIFYRDISSKMMSDPSYGKNFVLVLIESLGFINDPLIRDFLLKPLDNEYLYDNFYISSQRLEALDGSTVSAEFRELCGIEYSNFNNINPKLNCVPKLFNNMGYETHSAHPYLGGYFNRRLWWKDMGFKHRNFMTRIDNSSFTKCSGTYVSYCDEEYFSEIFKRVYTAKTPFFLYYLSIEGHLPTKKVSDDDIEECIENTKIKSQFNCENLIINREMIRAIINSLKELEVTGTDLYLIGDHSPKSIFISRSPKLYSENDVQVITLESKN